jgi:hypothetical protein
MGKNAPMINAVILQDTALCALKADLLSAPAETVLFADAVIIKTGVSTQRKYNHLKFKKFPGGPVKPEPFHHILLMNKKEKAVINMIIENMNEFEEALKGGSRDEITEKCSDVINILPCINLLFNVKIKKPFFRYNMKSWNYRFMIRMMYYCMNYSDNNKSLVRGALTDFVRLYLIRIEDVMGKYRIKNIEIDEWIKAKRSFYIKRLLSFK